MTHLIRRGSLRFRPLSVSLIFPFLEIELPAHGRVWGARRTELGGRHEGHRPPQPQRLAFHVGARARCVGVP